MRGLREGSGNLLRLAEEEVERHVPGNVVVELRRIRLGRVARERHGRQRLDVELHRLRRVLRLYGALGHHARHRVASRLTSRATVPPSRPVPGSPG